MAERWIARALEAWQAGALDQAEGECGPFLAREAAPPCHDAEGWHLGAVVAWQRGEFEVAWTRVERACALRPSEPTYWNTSGAVARSRGDLAGAARAFERAISLAPTTSGTWANLAAVRLELGDPTGAEVAARRATAIAPRDPQGWCNLGNALKLLGRISEARTAYDEALAIAPDHAMSLANLGGLCAEHNETSHAIELLQRALRIDPQSLPAWINLGQALQTRGDWNLAGRCFSEAASRGGGAGLSIRAGLVLPVIPGSLSEITTVRNRLIATLSEWEQHPPGPIVDPVHEIGTTPFHLAYHAENDVAPLSRLADIYRRIVPGLDETSRVAAKNRAGNCESLRVGFLSRHWHDHSNTRLMAGLVRYWPRTEGDRVVLLGFGERDDAWSRWTARAADEVVLLPQQLRSARERIAAADLDLLIYTDIGMEPLTYFLAHARLAPVQATTWGVPETTGLPTLDGYLSSELIEPEGADALYREPLVRLPLLPTVYPHSEQWRMIEAELTLAESPIEPGEAARVARTRGERARRALGYDAMQNLYVCPQSLFKLHPEFDAVLGEILARDSAGQLLLVAGMEPRWTELLLARLERSWSTGCGPRDGFARVRILPRMNSGEFLDLLAGADVLLDPWYFGGGNTTFEAVAFGTPVVTWPGRFLRGRVTTACYRQMGLTSDDENGGWPLVTTQANYAETAVRVAQDRVWAESLRNSLLEKGSQLFSRQEVVRSMRDWAVGVLRRKMSGGAQS